MLNDRGVDVLAFDSQLHEGGKILANDEEKKQLSSQKKCNEKIIDNFTVHRGGPEVLEAEKWAKGEYQTHDFKIWPCSLVTIQYI